MRARNTKSFIEKAKSIHGEKYDYNLVNYVNCKSKVKIICKKHGEFEQAPEKHFKGRGCQTCGGSKKLTKEEFINRANKVHNNIYNYSKVNYTNIHNKIIIICANHGEFVQQPNNHLFGNGCSKCKNDGKVFSTTEFINKAKKIHNNKYIYSETNYINSLTKVKIICPIHGDFWQTPNNHLYKKGCNKCSKNKRTSLKEFILKSNIIHNNKYDYSLSNYKNITTYVKIICKKHGIFKQKPREHLSGHGCQKCSKNKKIEASEFIILANKIHNYKYNYCLVEFNNVRQKTSIVCNLHGLFLQEPFVHLNGSGCPKCVNIISKNEIKWLNNLKIKEENRQISLPGLSNYIKVDGYDPETNTVYEFLGSYYHGDPIKYNLNDYNKKCKKYFYELYNKTIKREIKIRKAGYNYQFIWESDFKDEN